VTRKARITDCLDRVVAAVEELIDPAETDPATVVERKYTLEYLDAQYWKDNPDLLTKFTGRRVYVFGMETSQVEAATRGLDRNEYRVTLTTLERYTAARDAGSDAAFDLWTDERVAWVEDVIYDRLGEARSRTDRPGPMALRSAGYVPFSKEWTRVYDYDLLRTQGLFLSAVVIAFHKWE
jgi:hypothetical protein